MFSCTKFFILIFDRKNIKKTRQNLVSKRQKKQPKMTFTTLGRCKNVFRVFYTAALVIPKYHFYNVKYRSFNSYFGPKNFFICKRSTCYGWCGQRRRRTLDEHRHPHACAGIMRKEPQKMITE